MRNDCDPQRQLWVSSISLSLDVLLVQVRIVGFGDVSTLWLWKVRCSLAVELGQDNESTPFLRPCEQCLNSAVRNYRKCGSVNDEKVPHAMKFQTLIYHALLNVGTIGMFYKDLRKSRDSRGSRTQCSTREERLTESRLASLENLPFHRLIRVTMHRPWRVVSNDVVHAIAVCENVVDESDPSRSAAMSRSFSKKVYIDIQGIHGIRRI